MCPDASAPRRDEIPPNAETAVVTVHPQCWHQGRAIESDDVETFRVPVEDVLVDGDIVADDSGDSDRLKDHENAPDRARHWQGPFYVTIDGFE
jgi:hypothetical protein